DPIAHRRLIARWRTAAPEQDGLPCERPTVAGPKNDEWLYPCHDANVHRAEWQEHPQARAMAGKRPSVGIGGDEARDQGRMVDPGLFRVEFPAPDIGRIGIRDPYWPVVVAHASALRAARRRRSATHHARWRAQRNHRTTGRPSGSSPRLAW